MEHQFEIRQKWWHTTRNTKIFRLSEIVCSNFKRQLPCQYFLWHSKENDEVHKDRMKKWLTIKNTFSTVIKRDNLLTSQSHTKWKKILYTRTDPWYWPDVLLIHPSLYVPFFHAPQGPFYRIVGFSFSISKILFPIPVAWNGKSLFSEAGALNNCSFQSTRSIAVRRLPLSCFLTLPTNHPGFW